MAVFNSSKPRIGLPAVHKDEFKVPIDNPRRKGKREDMPYYLSELGYNAYEFAATRLSKLNFKPDMDKFKENAEKYDLFISLHAPYYISPMNLDPEKRDVSLDRFVEVYRWCSWLGAKRFVLHPGGYMGIEESKAANVVTEFIKDGHEKLKEKYPDESHLITSICCCVETMGKQGQVGSLPEIIDVVKSIDKDYVAPCIDFGHLYTRHLGKIDYEEIFNQVEIELGKKIVENLHVHISKIEFTEAGEKEHVPNSNEEWGPDFNDYIKLVVENGYNHVIINETPELQRDGHYLLDIYEKFAKKKIRD